MSGSCSIEWSLISLGLGNMFLLNHTLDHGLWLRIRRDHPALRESTSHYREILQRPDADNAIRRPDVPVEGRDAKLEAEDAIMPFLFFLFLARFV